MTKRTGTMTDRERVEALLNRKKPDRIPIHGFARGFSAAYTGTPIAELYNNPKVSYEIQRRTAKDLGWIFFPMFVCGVIGGWEFGGEIKWPTGEFAQAPTVARYPVENLQDAMSITLPDVRSSGSVPMMLEFYRLASQEQLDNEPFNVTIFGVGPFTTAANI
jgi:uroporphyrinogen-III decarboxylase